MADVLALRPQPHRGSVSRARGERINVAANVLRSSYDLYRAYARHFGLSFSDYCAITLARYHGLKDPAWTHVGDIDLTGLAVQPPLSSDPDSVCTVRSRIPPEHRATYVEQARALNASPSAYLGSVLALIHGEPPVAVLNLDRSQPDPVHVLRFPPSVRRLADGVYEAVAMASA